MEIYSTKHQETFSNFPVINIPGFTNKLFHAGTRLTEKPTKKSNFDVFEIKCECGEVSIPKSRL